MDIPDPDDPDHRYHGTEGEVVDVFEDDLSGLTGDPDHDFLYSVDLEDEGIHDFRYDDLESA